MRNFQKIVDKEDDNTLIEQERIDALLEIIKVFDHKINELKALIEKDEQNPE